MEAQEEEEGLEATPTYSVATTAAVFIFVSLIVERGIHKLRKFLKRKNQKPLRKVLDKMTEELMLLGFISLLLTVFQNKVTKICVPASFGKHMLRCTMSELSPAEQSQIDPESNFGRKLLRLYFSMENEDVGPKRLLAEEPSSSGPCSKGKVPFIALEVLHQLHILIFVLAVTHVFYCLVTVCLGFAKLHNWQKWENESRIDGYDGKQDLERRFCAILDSENYTGSSVGSRIGRCVNYACFENPILVWIVCFFRQFVASISREDYLVFRLAFLTNHHLAESFNFRDYVIRSMEVDFKKVIGISWWFWLLVVLFLLLDVHGWYTYFWIAFIPAIIVLIIGTKQQHIVATLTQQAKMHAANVRLVKDDPERAKDENITTDIASALSPSDNLFWFENPRLLLQLIHLVIFQNSFELAYFLWLVTIFGWNSCNVGSHKLLIIRVVIGLMTQLLASYSILPIYALVTQMGSQMKETVFTKDVFDGLQGWQAKVQRKKQEKGKTKGSGWPSAIKAEATVPVSSNVELPTVPERKSLADESPAEPDRKFEKICKSMYGKTRATEKVNGQASGPESSKSEVSTGPEKAVTDPKPPELNPHMTKRFQSMYGKAVAMERVKAARTDPK